MTDVHAELYPLKANKINKITLPHPSHIEWQQYPEGHQVINAGWLVKRTKDGAEFYGANNACVVHYESGVYRFIKSASGIKVLPPTEQPIQQLSNSAGQTKVANRPNFRPKFNGYAKRIGRTNYYVSPNYKGRRPLPPWKRRSSFRPRRFQRPY